MENSIGRGVVYLTNADGSKSRILGVEIRPQGVTFRDPDGGGGPLTLFAAAGSLGPGMKGSGSIIFDSWPAAPRDEFIISGLRVTKLTDGSEDFSVQVTGQPQFGATAHTWFSGLDVTLRHVTGRPLSAEPGSKVVLQVLGASVTLSAAVDESRGLVFVGNGPETLAIEDIGTLGVRGTVAAQPFDRWQGVLSCYPFGEGRGDEIHDISASTTLVATAIPGGGNPGRGNSGGNSGRPNAGGVVQWTSGGITLDGTYYLTSQGVNTAVRAIRRTRALTVETWLDVKNGAQAGPAQILAFQANNKKNWFTLAQGGAGSTNDYLNIDIQFDLTPPREWESPLTSPSGSLPNGLAHVVYTRDADGHERVFVNTKLVAERDYPGSLGQWSDDVVLIVGDDKKNDPVTDQWQGRILHLSIYERALDEFEVFRRYVPIFALEGATFRLDRVPAPLAGVSVPAKLSSSRPGDGVGRSKLELTASGEVDLSIRPNLGLRSLSYELAKVDNNPWSFGGVCGVRIWQGVAGLQASRSPSKLFTLTSPADQDQDLGASFDIPGLGAIAFGGIELAVTGSGTDLGWSLSSGRYLAFTALPAALPPDVAVDSDFKLLQPTLGLDDTDVLLQGQWLGEDLVLHTRVDAGAEYRFEGQTSVSFDVAVDLPAPVHEQSGVTIGRDIHLDGATLNVAFDLVFRNRGFFATLDRSLDYKDAQGGTHKLKLVRRRLYQAPATRLLLLEATTAELGERIDRLFAANRRRIEIDGLDPAIPLALLGLASGQTIAARFLEQDLTLTAQITGADWRFVGDLSFSIPFSLDLPALFDDETGAQLTDAITIVNESMHVEMSVELTLAGFFATLQARFGFTDPSGTAQSIVVPQQRLYTAPRTRNELLGELLRVVESSAATLFAGQGRNVADYYLTLGAKQPRIMLSTTGASEATVATTLPNLFASNTKLTSANGVFVVDQSDSGCRLTLNLGGRDSAALRGDHDDLLTKVAAASLAAASPLGAGAVSVLRRRIAERVPADYGALLYYYYGWDADAGRIDLEGGMRLRVDLQHYQFAQASDPSARRGFVGSGSFHIPVNSYTFARSDGSHAQLLGFGPFASQLRTNAGTDIAYQGAGGVFDLLKDGNRKAFFRMFFPAQPSTGLGPERVVTIIGTDTLADMLAVTSDFNPDGESLPTKGSNFFFRGKAFIVPEIQVFVAGQAVHVPVGTSLRQLIESSDHVPAAALPGQDLRAFIGRARPLRLVHEGVDSKAEYRFINATTGAAVNGTDVLDLPLVKGDRFSL